MLCCLILLGGYVCGRVCYVLLQFSYCLMECVFVAFVFGFLGGYVCV